jgi:hypothetical protein
MYPPAVQCVQVRTRLCEVYVNEVGETERERERERESFISWKTKYSI